MVARDVGVQAIHDGAVKRMRPKAMAVMAAGIGLVPFLWAHGAGAETMRRLAVPMIGRRARDELRARAPHLSYVAKRAMLWRRFRHLSQVTRSAA